LIVEKNLVIALLKLTREGSVAHELINKEARIPLGDARKLLQRLQCEGLINVHEGQVEANNVQRLKLAVRALNSGGDLESVSSLLQWQEFEGMASIALQQNGYDVTKNLRIKHADRRWEIDIVGCRKPLVICIDCKHWHRSMHASATIRIAEEQVERTEALAESLPNPNIKLKCAKWDKTRFIPVVLSLMQGALKFHENVPIVSVLQLQDFLSQLPACLNSIYQVPRTNEERLGLGQDF
jgi:Holliday junction resolvase-like predicted endonuclease